MKRGRSGRGFTLVELLVVIGIIALLISILLPSLNRAREQANLLKCQANLHSMGQLFQIYASENYGYAPPIWDNLNYTTFADVLTLEGESPKKFATVTQATSAGMPATAASLLPADDDSGIFHDVDVPPDPWFYHSIAYCGNMRVMGHINDGANNLIWDPRPAPAGGPSAGGVLGPYGYKPRRFASVQRSAQVMLVWCGPVNIGSGTNYGTDGDNIYDVAIDDYQMSGGHGFCYPTPAQASFLPADYSNPIALGINPLGGVNNSSMTPPVTVSYLQLENRDLASGDTGGGSGFGGHNTCGMRFRHMNNTECNFLFCDMHVESRLIGGVYAKDICCNP